MNKLIIFTDLDGTLLQPGTYAFNEARPALEILRERNIPLVVCSSKTRAEIEVWRKRLENTHPFVSENGGGVFIPSGYFPFADAGVRRGGYISLILGSSYDIIRKTFIQLREEMSVSVRGFGDMAVEEIAALTGLSRDESILAATREFDEPFIFGKNGAEEAFLRAIEGRGFRWTRGRFFHMTGANDKGRAVVILKERYEARFGTVTTIGLGDNLNDVPFLRVVDKPVLVRNEEGVYDESVDLPNLLRADGAGPEGWNRAVLKLLDA